MWQGGPHPSGRGLRLEPSRRGRVCSGGSGSLWGRAQPAAGVTVSTHGLPGLILLSPCLSVTGVSMVHLEFPTSSLSRPRACRVLPAHSHAHLVCPSPSWALGLLLEPLIDSGGAGGGRPRIRCATPALAASSLHLARCAGCCHGDDLSRDAIGPPPLETDP